MSEASTARHGERRLEGLEPPDRPVGDVPHDRPVLGVMDEQDVLHQGQAA